jgi:hypothetical protein
MTTCTGFSGFVRVPTLTLFVGMAVSTGTVSAQLFPGTQIPTGAASNVVAMRAADLNQDGRPDFTTGNTSGTISVVLSNNSAAGWSAAGAGTLHIMPGSGTGSFGAPASFAPGSPSTSIHVRDINSAIRVIRY